MNLFQNRYIYINIYIYISIPVNLSKFNYDNGLFNVSLYYSILLICPSVAHLLSSEAARPNCDPCGLLQNLGRGREIRAAHFQTVQLH